jgi:hypothetical protein
MPDARVRVSPFGRSGPERRGGPGGRDTNADYVGLSVSVAVDLEQALVADPEVMGDLVEDNPSYLAAKALRVVSVETQQRSAVDGDLVRQHPAVMAAAPRQRHTLIETEQSVAGGGSSSTTTSTFDICARR